MSTRLIQVVSFLNVAPAATVNLPHDININGAAKKPDFMAADTAGFTVTATATQVSVTNNNAAPASVNVWLELKHSIPRELGAAANLVPQPFVASPGGVSGGSAVTTDASLAGDGSGGNPLSTMPGGINGLDTIVGIAKPTVQAVLFDDCITSGNLYFQTSGTGAQAGLTSDGDVANAACGLGFGLVTNDPNDLAVVSAQVGVVDAGQTTPVPNAGTHNIQIDKLDLAVFQARIQVVTAPPIGGADYLIDFGWTSSLVSFPGSIVFGAGVANFGNGNWWCKATGSANPAPVDTGIAVDQLPHIFTIVLDPTAQTAKFYIDGVLRVTMDPGAAPYGNRFFPYALKVGAVTTALGFVVADWFYFRGDVDRS